MVRSTKLGIVLGGYGAAFAAAAGVTALHVALTAPTPDAIASSGMYAGGDLLLFLGVLGAAALVPTAAALVFARAHPRFAPVLAAAALAVALSGALAWLAFVYPPGAASRKGWLALADVLALLRVLGAPLVASGLAFAALVAPSRESRRAVMIALAIEALVCLWDVFHFVVAPRA